MAPYPFSFLEITCIPSSLTHLLPFQNQQKSISISFQLASSTFQAHAKVHWVQIARHFASFCDSKCPHAVEQITGRGTRKWISGAATLHMINATQEADGGGTEESCRDPPSLCGIDPASKGGLCALLY